MSVGILPTSLTLDEDQAFEAILSDIPLFCVGLMAIGTITFIFIMKRTNLASLYLCSASLLLFVAAIFDLGQLLIREPMTSDRGSDQSVVSGFIVAREVGLGLSYGFLFLFAWKAVAERPWDERSGHFAQAIKTSTPSPPHSARWTRWGFLGVVLKWFTLVLVIVIPLLQIIWRLLSSQQQYGSVYTAESTLEIVTSVIFVLKIVLNTLVSPSTSWWTPFQSYLGLVLALLITGANGVGNLISFAFSETVLGRFLHAIGVYVLLLWNLINIFHRRRILSRAFSDQENLKISTLQEKPEEHIKGEKGLMQPRAQTPSIVMLDRVTLSPSESGQILFRVPNASRFSAIVNHVEQNETLAGITRTISTRSSHKSPVMLMAPRRPRRPDLQFDIITPTFACTNENPEFLEEPLTPAISPTTNSGGRNILINQFIQPQKPARHQIGGQDNLEYASQPTVVPQPPDQNPSISSFDELMRQQNELDRSIAKLRLLSSGALNIRPSESAPAFESSSIASDTVTSTKSSSQSLRTESLSPHSEFSFSAFPIPPNASETSVESRFAKPNTQSSGPPEYERSQPLPLSPWPETPSQVSMAVKMTSAGTRYDVTSFIDNLTEPGSQVSALINGPDPLQSPENEAHYGEEIQERRPLESTLNVSRISNLKPMLLPTSAFSSKREDVPFPSVHPAAHFPRVGPRDSSITLKPFFLGTSTTSVPPSLPSSTMVLLASRKGTRAARVPAHKWKISPPRLKVPGILDEGATAVYERPRPPPILFGLPGRPKPKAQV